jgi:hypothetical protein
MPEKDNNLVVYNDHIAQMVRPMKERLLIDSKKLDRSTINTLHYVTFGY